MATQAELETRLAELEAARHRLLVGSRAASVDSPGGENVKFSEVTLKDLDTAIADTKRQIAYITGTGGGPIHFGFSLNR